MRIEDKGVLVVANCFLEYLCNFFLNIRISCAIK